MRTELEFLISEEQCDFYMQLKLQHMFLMMQKAAYADLLNYGHTRKSLMSEDMAFLLRRVLVKVYESPKYEDKIQLATAQVGIKGISYTRDYQFMKDGKLLAEASSQWFLSTISDKRPLRPTQLGTTSYPEHALQLEFLDRPEHDIHSAQEYNIIKAGYSSIDGNMHVNNSEYISWISDAPCALEYFKAGKYSFDILYRNEVIQNDIISMREQDDVISGVVNDEAAFYARFYNV